jgi:hypothetical protein
MQTWMNDPSVGCRGPGRPPWGCWTRTDILSYGRLIEGISRHPGSSRSDLVLRKMYRRSRKGCTVSMTTRFVPVSDVLFRTDGHCVPGRRAPPIPRTRVRHMDRSTLVVGIIRKLLMSKTMSERRHLGSSNIKPCENMSLLSDTVTQYQAVFEYQTNLFKTVNRKANVREGRGESKRKRDKSYSA